MRARNHQPSVLGRRAALALGLATINLLSGFAAPSSPATPASGTAGVPAMMDDEAFVMADGARLPYRCWQPDASSRQVVLALHGFDDSRDAWEYPGPAFADAGIAIYAPDQRGFGAAPERGRWPGTATLVSDAASMARLLAARHPDIPLVLMGESMGAAVLMALAAGHLAPGGVRYVLIAPAVWGRSHMNPFYTAVLWVAAHFAPGLRFRRAPVPILASDNREALIRLAEDPLTIHATSVDALWGLVNLMDAADRAAPKLRIPALFLYGGHDELVPKPAMAATWQALPRGGEGGPRLAFYPAGYHLLLRDLDRKVPTGDILSWLADPWPTLRSGAEEAAELWLEAQPRQG